jgi:hypothetical protein
MRSQLFVEEVVNLDLEGALEAVLEEMRLLTDDSEDDFAIWEEISCLDLDDPCPILEPEWVDQGRDPPPRQPSNVMNGKSGHA